ncbi:MAG: hypothetical protein HFH86_05360 [Bacilli bacterium]|jgi:hypothetical protein|nr:hypothetical protein [Bacilli bacterium]
MTLYEELYPRLNNLESFYRFEGYKSYQNYIFNDPFANPLQTVNKYVYYSKTLKHHLYYTSKRIEQFLKNEILMEKDRNLWVNMDIKKIKEIINQILNFQYRNTMSSIELKYCPIFQQLMSQNTVNNMREKETNQKYIECCDLTRAGGGYGLSEEWLLLLNYLTILYCYREINMEDVKTWFQIFRSNQLKYFPFKFPTIFLEEKRNRKIVINHQLSNHFLKYDIMETMERLVDNHLVNPRSPFGKNPNKMIKETIFEFEKVRKRTLDTLEEIYEQKIKNESID